MADVLLLMVTAIWGGTFVMVKDAVSVYPVFPFLTIRFVLATAGLLIVGARRLRSLSWRGLGAGALIGVFLFAGYALQTIGLQYTSSSKAGLITGMSVVMVPFLSAVVIRRAPGTQAMIGVVLATVGLVLLSLGPVNSLRVERGDLIILGCALGFALHIVSVSVFAPRHDPLALTVVQVATVAVLSGAVSLTGSGWATPSVQVWYAALFTGVLATALAFALQNHLQRFTTPTHTALIFAAEPVFAALFGVWLAGETLTHRGIAGGVLIVAGTLASEVDWSERTARDVSRVLSPPVTSIPLLGVLSWHLAGNWQQALLWGGSVWLLAIGAPVLVRRAAARWAPADRDGGSRRLRRVLPVLIEALGPLAATGVALSVQGAQLLALVSLFALVATLYRSVAGRGEAGTHVVAAAASATALTATWGVVAAPTLLLVGVVAWARVKLAAQKPRAGLVAALSGALAVLSVLYLSRMG